jgi:hypothetical protein
MSFLSSDSISGETTGLSPVMSGIAVLASSSSSSLYHHHVHHHHHHHHHYIIIITTISSSSSPSSSSSSSSTLHAGHRNGERGNCLSGGKDNTGGKDQHIMTAAIYELGSYAVVVSR